MSTVAVSARVRQAPALVRIALRTVRVLALVAVLSYVVLSAYMLSVMMKADRKPVEGTPARIGAAYEPIDFESAFDRVGLRGWFLPASGDRAIIMVHGINSNRASEREDRNVELAKALVDRGLAVLMFDLRAHGESGGDRIGLGWDERGDVQGAVALLRMRGFQPGKIGILGTSYGAATALLATAVTPDIGGVVADSGFADARDLLSSEINRKTGLPPIFTPGIATLGSLLYHLDFDAIPPLLAVPRIAPRPILFIHGDADTRIPYEHSQRLKAASSNPSDELWIVPGAGHTGAYEAQPNEYVGRVTAFFERALR